MVTLIPLPAGSHVAVRQGRTWPSRLPQTIPSTVQSRDVVTVGSVTWDIREVVALGAYWEGIPNAILDDVDEVLASAAESVKNSMKAVFASTTVGGGGVKPGNISPYVSYDRYVFGKSLLYEIGPTYGQGHAGSLASIAVYGGANGGGGTVDIEPILRGTDRLDDTVGGIIADLLSRTS